MLQNHHIEIFSSKKHFCDKMLFNDVSMSISTHLQEMLLLKFVICTNTCSVKRLQYETLQQICLCLEATI